jgi:hypothetical protein
MDCHHCSLRKGCELLRRISSNLIQPTLNRAIAEALVEAENIAATIEGVGIDALTSYQLAGVLLHAMKRPPGECRVCRSMKAAA